MEIPWSRQKTPSSPRTRGPSGVSRANMDSRVRGNDDVPCRVDVVFIGDRRHWVAAFAATTDVPRRRRTAPANDQPRRTLGCRVRGNDSAETGNVIAVHGPHIV